MDCRSAFADSDRLSTEALLQRLIGLDKSPWGDIKGKPLDERGLAHRLRQYSIESRQIRINDITLKGYRREDFIDPWQRYAPLKADRKETNETSETPAKKLAKSTVILFRMMFRISPMFRIAFATFRMVFRISIQKTAMISTLFRMFRMFRTCRRPRGAPASNVAASLTALSSK